MMAKPVSQENKLLARYVAEAFGGTPHVREYVHDTEPVAVDILWCADRPQRAVTSYSTIGLSDQPIPWGEGQFPLRIELAGACASREAAFPNILSSAAFRMLRTGAIYHPGAAIEGYVRMYVPSTSVPNLYFTAPFPWDRLQTFDAGTKRVTWLLAVPISDAERAYLKDHGEQSLERLFEERQIDIFDLHRPSAA